MWSLPSLSTPVLKPVMMELWSVLKHVTLEWMMALAVELTANQWSIFGLALVEMKPRPPPVSFPAIMEQSSLMNSAKMEIRTISMDALETACGNLDGPAPRLLIRLAPQFVEMASELQEKSAMMVTILTVRAVSQIALGALTAGAAREETIQLPTLVSQSVATASSSDLKFATMAINY